MDFKPAKLILKSGETFSGINFGSNEPKIGELIFNTAMTGYQEIITDLSYTDQLICFTYPQIGNTGVNKDCLLYTSPSPRDLSTSRMPSSA